MSVSMATETQGKYPPASLVDSQIPPPTSTSAFTRLYQLHRPSTNGPYTPNGPSHRTAQRALQAHLEGLCPAGLWYGGAHRTCCPRPIVMARHHVEQIGELHGALVVAVTDIVGRWWTDSDARFPERMSLEEGEEEVLRWMDAQDAETIALFAQRLGSWRPDFIVEQDAAGGQRIRITEINARFPFNGFMHVVYGTQALRDIGVCGGWGTTLESAVGGMLRRILRPGLPVHLLKGEEPGGDIHMVVDYTKRHRGFAPRFISPADLRLFSPEGNKAGLYCVVREGDPHASTMTTVVNEQGKHLEPIHQVILELRQEELLTLPRETLHQLSTRGINDLRTILLVHDKRMLGIIKQEIPALRTRGILTPSQAETLDRGIPETILPGSAELERLAARCRLVPGLTGRYVRKPVRSGKGDGIVLGGDLRSEEWVAGLEAMMRPAGSLAVSDLCVVQRRIEPILYSVVLGETETETEKVSECPLVGTFHSVGGEYLGAGVWRSGLDWVSTISRGGPWMCPVMQQDLD